jgi:hypothetical protein
MDAGTPATGLPSLSTLILAVGALGTAAFGLVDALKALPGGGVSSFGFKFVRQMIEALTKGGAADDDGGLSRKSLTFTLRSHWISGVAIQDQVNIAKSLIKLRLTSDSAPALAKATGVDTETLKAVADSIRKATPLTPPQSDVYGRFDLMLTTLLDQAYQRGAQRYRNGAKAAAVVIAVALSIVANSSIGHPISVWSAVLLGLVATPVAPVAKDLASAVTSAAKAIQAWKS